jgi:hypothetical protein
MGGEAAGDSVPAWSCQMPKGVRGRLIGRSRAGTRGNAVSFGTPRQRRPIFCREWVFAVCPDR